MNQQLLTNAGAVPDHITTDYFLECFRAANRGTTPFEIVKSIVDTYRGQLSPEELAEIQRIGAQAQAQFLSE